MLQHPARRNRWAHDLRWVVAAGLVAITLLNGGGCDPAALPTADNAAALPEGTAQAVVTATGGGTLTGSTGIVLEVPPGAIDADTGIAVVPLAVSDLDPACVAGVRFEPGGLELAEAATLTIPLPEPWPLDSPPIELEFKGSDPNEAYPTGRLVELSADGRSAIFEVTHFSGKICATNCHTGVWELLRKNYAAAGCSNAGAARRVKAKYPDVDVPSDCGSLNGIRIQAVLDTFFEELGGYDAGEDVPAEVIQQLIDAADAGRHVAFAFKRSAFGSRSETAPRFYSGVAHTAIAELVGEQWQIRNVVVAGKAVLAALGGTNLAYWPLSDLNGFRNAPQGVAVEVQACGQPGCLGPEGSDPGDPRYPYVPLERRMIPWNAVRIYVEYPDNDPCYRLAGCWRLEFDADQEEGWLVLEIDSRGNLARLWLAYAESELTAGVGAIEYLRFTTANSPVFEESVANLEQIVALNTEQTHFTLAVSFDGITEDEDGQPLVAFSYFLSINDAALSQNEPGEFFTGTIEEVVEVFSKDEEGNIQSEEVRVELPVTGRRVACPDASRSDVYSQEELEALGETTVSTPPGQ